MVGDRTRSKFQRSVEIYARTTCTFLSHFTTRILSIAPFHTMSLLHRFAEFTVDSTAFYSSRTTNMSWQISFE